MNSTVYLLHKINNKQNQCFTIITTGSNQYRKLKKNSTILKSNNLAKQVHFIKKSLKSEGQQFHQYQQNEQSPLNSKSLTTTYDVGNLDTEMWQVKSINGIQPSLDNQVLSH